MTTTVPDVVSGAEHWTAVLRAGGATTIPRSAPGAPGVAGHGAPLPATLVRDVAALAAGEGVGAGAVLLAAHASVLRALSGDADVVVGVPVDGAVLPVPVPAGDVTWRELVRAAARALRDAETHADVDVEALARSLDVDVPTFETTLTLPTPRHGSTTPTPGAAEPRHGSTTHGEGTPGSRHGSITRAEGTPGSRHGSMTAVEGAFAVGVRSADSGGLVLDLRYRTDLLDDAAASRIAGYHLTALAAAVADPDSSHRAVHLLGADEVHHQVRGLAGPPRELPDRRVHELVAEQARQRPDDVVAARDGVRWTYRELDERVNRLARALLARGLGREDVVAVVTERNLDWLAAVLAVFAAGGVYLPIEPHFPAERIRGVLDRADARLALTEDGSAATLDAALDGLPDVTRMTVAQAWAEPHDPTPPGIAVDADQAAYIYFTSGSTGLPKGAMCEHAGMLNHLLAKIEDLGIGEGTVVAQTAPQCFDISLWQLVAAPMVGGCTVLVPQDDILDVRRFLDTVDAAAVEVVQLVPSYLEVVLAHLRAEPRALAHLRRISATGEALKVELLARWLEAHPHVALVNAYGLTETSDDTNHAVLDRVPADGRVPLGPPIPGVHVYVVDDDLRPVPLGAPGEIVFSGVCVGRGYVNDPDRTAAVFVPDPLRPGERLYRSGDHGRWLPDGSLAFLGRRDTQVKVRGFRIEIGEVDDALLRAPGVRDAAVVVAERGSGERDLVAFWAGDAAPDALPAELARTLPAYMVPAAFHHVDVLPLTANGKIDRKALTARAAQAPEAARTGEAPATAAEHRVAAAFARVLALDPESVARTDDFFARGGTSLSAVKLVLALKRAVALPDVVATPVVADLALLLDP